jgi:hypothetical protein
VVLHIPVRIRCIWVEVPETWEQHEETHGEGRRDETTLLPDSTYLVTQHFTSEERWSPSPRYYAIGVTRCGSTMLTMACIPLMPLSPFLPPLGSTTLERRRIDVSESDGINESLMNNGKE